MTANGAVVSFASPYTNS